MLGTIRANLAATALGLLAAILLIIAIVQTIRINGIFWIDGLKDQIEDCARDRNELRAISSKRDEQKAETEKRVEQAERGNREADKIADKIEAAPLPGSCRTPDAILGADL